MITGCIADSLTVDGVEEINLSTPQRKRAMRNLASWYLKHPECLNSLLQHTLLSCTATKTLTNALALAVAIQ